MTETPAATATLTQRQAADARASVWVAASAGTGKTKVLADRVLTLLLSGTKPDRILCLTYTKAAAAEMANRISERLGRWATDQAGDLAADLGNLLGHPPEAPTMATARRLFATVLDVPGGLNIQTIHAFCQSLLRRFPIEAGVPTHFQLLDDRDAAELTLAVRDRVLGQARDGGDADLAAALAVVTRYVGEQEFADLMGDLAAARRRFAGLLGHYGSVEAVIDALRARLDIGSADTADGVLRAACEDGAVPWLTDLRAIVPNLLGGSKTDIARGQALADWLAADADGRVALWPKYVAAFLAASDKEDARVLAKLATKKVDDGCPGLTDLLEREGQRVLAAVHKTRAAQIAEATGALLRLAGALLQGYAAAKRSRARLDYDDLIGATRDLLERPGVAPWVLFKLDGGLDHILIDEAQDTSPDQWRLIGALAAEFFAGEGAGRPQRTIFAVGDAKQSIYSFQGANPAEFTAMRDLYQARIAASGGQFREVPLVVSFRSTEAVLAAVDGVFAADDARAGVALDGRPVEHRASRSGQAGLVELWPPVEPRPGDVADPWKPPVERITGEKSRTRLARLIAKRIASMIQSKDRLDSADRPVRAGDFLVLVRRRGPFVEELVRELKLADVPVAGADRMHLTEQMAVMDLIALGRFLLLPEDDLNLACLLKSPLVGLDEEALYRLAQPRTGSLWRALKDQAAADARVAEAYRLLADLLGQADFVPPFELFAGVLAAGGGRKRLLARLGQEADDPINEFLAQAEIFGRSHPPSLQGFLYWLERGDVEIKRDLEEGDGSAVRIMTVHGAKGLQAPIVILPDTLQVPTKVQTLLWDGDGGDGPGLVFWPPRRSLFEPETEALRQAAVWARDEEYRRLLYVALTRAEDRLYICGYDGEKTAPDGCWYNLIKRGLVELPGIEEVEDPFLRAAPEIEAATTLRLSRPQTAPPKPEHADGPAIPDPGPLPDWLCRPPEPEPEPPQPLAPSRPSMPDPPVRSPLDRDDQHRFRRGRLVHRLLQTLPDLSADLWDGAARAFLARMAGDLPEDFRDQVAAETVAVLRDSAFAALFGPGSRAEVPVVGLVGGQALSGQVDRLLVTEHEVLVVDFKTNRPPPHRVDDVAPAYLAQMAAYRAALRGVWPDRPVRCALLWTDGPRLMALPDALLDGFGETSKA